LARSSEQQQRPPAPAPGPRRGGRTIYVARSGNDMLRAYDSVVRELEGLGHLVVPETSIPVAPGTKDFIDANLARADMVVHLLGEKPGPTLDEELAPIVRLQLERSALRAAAEVETPGKRPFRRIVWAPRTVIDDDAPNGGEVNRDPLAVFQKFGGGKPLACDKIEGGVRSHFIDVLKQEAEASAPRRTEPDFPADGVSHVYIAHNRLDEQFGIDLAQHLRGAPNVRVVMATIQGKPRELAAAQKRALEKCQGVVLCWAQASEAWVRGEWDKFREWNKFNRTERFVFREVVTGPPPESRKKNGHIVLDIAESDGEEMSDVTEDNSKLAEVARELLKRLGHASP